MFNEYNNTPGPDCTRVYTEQVPIYIYMLIWYNKYNVVAILHQEKKNSLKSF